MKKSVWWYSWPLLGAVGAFVCDRVTKTFFVQYPDSLTTLWPQHLWFQLQFNYDMALSLPLIPGLYYALLVIVIAAVSVIGVRAVQRGHTIDYWFATLILTGALGNILDRIWYGGVVDFIHLQIFSNWHSTIFNVADIVIVGSVFIWGLIMVWYEQVSKNR